MRVLLIVLLCLSFWTAKAQQEEVEIQIGDTLFFAACTGESYTYIDLYVKTRFEKDSISFDTINNWAFYNRFFNTGDFDVSRLPCRYQDQYGIIKHMMSIESADGQWTNIVIAMIKDGSSVAYLIEDAFLEEEVIFAPAE